MRWNLPCSVSRALSLLNEYGYEAYIVGGCVRDAMMGLVPNDWDITTSALPEQTLEVFREFRTIETGIRHGTVTVVIENTPLEITTYRVDGNYSDGRRPDSVSFTPSLTEDLRRRDFTVNAMAYHPDVGLVDPFGGCTDLKKKVIRCVGRPHKRFTEDTLRILRGLRFSSTLGFTIHPATARAIHRLGQTLSCVSAERISVEFCKLLCGINREEILCRYADVLSVIVPAVDFKVSAKRVVLDELLANLGALMYDLTPNEAEESCNRLRLSGRMTEDVVTLIKHRDMALETTRSGVLRALHTLGPRLLNELLCLRTAMERSEYTAFRSFWDKLVQDNDCCYRIKDLAVSGEDLLSIGVLPGPQIGITLNRLLEAVMDGVCPNQKEDLLEYALKKPVQ